MQTNAKNQSLNLARKWRSKTFNQIVGQSLSVRILKNSLYANYFFPVYLFAGQRGCGKTSTARIFAAAVNCTALTLFQENPKQYDLPCLICDSCRAMADGLHPDFIEIDAASHTGVDNVRLIIDAAALLPILGNKKIYLIDEAHMLSKAAFNAFLKILEEPPTSVLFLLATTDPNKIIDTIRSRCFQLFFKSIVYTDLCNHLEFICKQESIAFTVDGLQMIARQSEGSVRDAINLLEQVRFSTALIDKPAVGLVIGNIEEEILLQLLECIIRADIESVMSWLSIQKIEQYRPQIVWDSFLELIRATIWQSYGQSLPGYERHQESFKRILQYCKPSLISSYLELLYSYESLFLKTVCPHRLFETLLIQLCGLNRKPVSAVNNDNSVSNHPTIIEKEKVIETVEQSNEPWTRVVATIASLDDPLLHSIFKQGRYIAYDSVSGNLAVAFAKNFSFFNEWLENSKLLWQPILEQNFGTSVLFNAQFIDEPTIIEPGVVQNSMPTSTVSKITSTKLEQPKQFVTKKFISTKKEIRQKNIDVSDKTMWPKANLLLSYFPGTIVEIQEQNNE